MGASAVMEWHSTVWQIPAALSRMDRRLSGSRPGYTTHADGWVREGFPTPPPSPTATAPRLCSVVAVQGKIGAAPQATAQKNVGA
eukprot:gene25442-biopygen19494